MITPLLALVLLAAAADPLADRIDAKAGRSSVTIYERFAVKLAENCGTWRFAEDRGSPATAADFDRLPRAEASGQ